MDAIIREQGGGVESIAQWFVQIVSGRAGVQRISIWNKWSDSYGGVGVISGSMCSCNGFMQVSFRGGGDIEHATI